MVAASALVRISGCIAKKCGDQPLHDSNVNNDRSGAFASIVPPPPPGEPLVPAQLPVDHWIAERQLRPALPDGAASRRRRPTTTAPTSRSAASRCSTSRRRRTPDPHSLDNNFDGIGCQFDDY